MHNRPDAFAPKMQSENPSQTNKVRKKIEVLNEEK